MKYAVISGLPIAVMLAMIAPSQTSYAQVTYSGTVEQVWEDGFRLKTDNQNTNSRTVRVDTWDLYGDNTPAHIAVGDRVTINGEMSAGEFDAVSLTQTDR